MKSLPPTPGPLPLLTTAQMDVADQRAPAYGVSGKQLMEAAGAAVVGAIIDNFGKRPAHVLCGPGNNGGDGFVVARLLAAKGWAVSAYLLGKAGALRGDAAKASSSWTGPVHLLSQTNPAADDIVIDALFGAGLSGPIIGEAATVLNRVRTSGAAIVAVDVPSGLDGASGELLGEVCRADLTVTFVSAKPGHILLPGRELCGQLIIADIGMPEAALADAGARTWLNTPALWQSALPDFGLASHKYSRGHCAVIGGEAATSGASRLAALGALRIGAGLVTVFSPPDALAVNAAHFNAVMVRSFWSVQDLIFHLDDNRFGAIATGPGFGTQEPQAKVLADLLAFATDRDRLTVLDADAITLLSRQAEVQLPKRCVLTPHEGEFARMFPDFAGSKLERARAAAQAVGAIVILKGPDTVIAAPDGRATINANAPPTLATAGSGDVLTGLVAGLGCQGMAPFEAAAAAVWLHGAAAAQYGAGLIADDLPELAGQALAGLTDGGIPGFSPEFRPISDLG